MMWHGWSDVWWWIMLVAMLAFLGFLVALFWALGRHDPQWPEPHDDGADEAERILDERYARGEIDDEEFRHRRAVLRGSDTADHPATR